MPAKNPNHHPKPQKLSPTRDAGKKGRPRVKHKAARLEAVRCPACQVVRLHNRHTVAVLGQQRCAAEACTGGRAGRAAWLSVSACARRQAGKRWAARAPRAPLFEGAGPGGLWGAAGVRAPPTAVLGTVKRGAHDARRLPPADASPCCRTSNAAPNHHVVRLVAAISSASVARRVQVRLRGQPGGAGRGHSPAEQRGALRQPPPAPGAAPLAADCCLTAGKGCSPVGKQARWCGGPAKRQAHCCLCQSHRPAISMCLLAE